MSLFKLGICTNCGKFTILVNAKYKLCQYCNNKRLNKDKISQKTIETIQEDEAFYLKLWESRAHYCEECGTFLGNSFRNKEGKIIKYRYSHILGKKAYPEFRRNEKNINILCLDHHYQWDFGDKKSMKIYPNNQIIIQELLQNK